MRERERERESERERETQRAYAHARLKLDSVECDKVRRTGHTPISSGSAESDVALLPPPSLLVGPATTVLEMVD